MKPNRRNPQGGRLSKEMPIDASNVLLYCPTCRRGVRIGRRYEDDGRKERYCKKCGAGLGAISKPRAKYAEKAVVMRTEICGVGSSCMPVTREKSWPGCRNATRKRSCRSCRKKLGRKNVLSLPRLQKIVVNMGVGKALQDKNRMEQAAEQLDADHRPEGPGHARPAWRSAASGSARATRSAAG